MHSSRMRTDRLLTVCLLGGASIIGGASNLGKCIGGGGGWVHPSGLHHHGSASSEGASRGCIWEVHPSGLHLGGGGCRCIQGVHQSGLLPGGTSGMGFIQGDMQPLDESRGCINLGWILDAPIPSLIE